MLRKLPSAFGPLPAFGVAATKCSLEKWRSETARRSKMVDDIAAQLRLMVAGGPLLRVGGRGREAAEQRLGIAVRLARAFVDQRVRAAPSAMPGDCGSR
ncbi:MAG: hypothetical protein ACM3YM_09645 [Sphingomonadales bacterium]